MRGNLGRCSRSLLLPRGNTMSHRNISPSGPGLNTGMGNVKAPKPGRTDIILLPCRETHKDKRSAPSQSHWEEESSYRGEDFHPCFALFDLSLPSQYRYMTYIPFTFKKKTWTSTNVMYAFAQMRALQDEFYMLYVSMSEIIIRSLVGEGGREDIWSLTSEPLCLSPTPP